MMDVNCCVEAACQTDNDVFTSSMKQGSNTLWYKDKRYERYWNHRRRVTKWFHTAVDYHRKEQCREYYRKMAKYHTAMANWMRQMESYYTDWYNTWVRHQQVLSHQSGCRPVMTVHSGSRNRLKRRGSKQWHQSDKRQRRNAEQLSQSRLISEHEQFKMEITPDMLDFFLHSAKHKKERDAKKKEQKASEDERIDIGDVNVGKNKATVMPPSDRPGFRRTTEMRLLYGKGAAMIHGMETAMQLNYDRNCDLQQPKLWPQLPITIKFT